MSGSDDDPRPLDAESRPRPQYGEYATPEEQRARIEVPDASAALAAGESPEPAAPTRTSSVRPAPGLSPSVATQRRAIDRVVTIGLLGLGLFNVITGIPTYLDYSTFAEAFIRGAALDATFTNVAAGRLWGLVAAILFAAVWFATAVLSYLQLRRERRAFWIPLVGASVAALVVTICLAVPLFTDPGILDALARLGATEPTP